MEDGGGTEGIEGVVVELLDEEGAGEFGSGGSSGGGDGDGDGGFCSSSSRLPSIRSSRDGRVLSRGLPRPNIRYCCNWRESMCVIGRTMYNGDNQGWTRVTVILVVEIP